ncbi:MAG TPA: nuclear transport factor 2 family protein [Chitinophagaceae bacterium]|nr:nuclear transport factor 2 family protein [Chitinophagaceae bacterium]
MKTRLIYSVLTFLLTVFLNSYGAIKGDPITTFEQFFKAQNQHDLAALDNLLIDSPDFIWITKGQTVWGKNSALKRFETLYKGHGV